jgi:Tfp pilus assembly protein PilF
MRSMIAVLVLSLLSVSTYAATEAELIAQGKAAFEKRDFDKAAELYEKAVAANPKSAQAHYLLGGAYGRQAQQAGLLKQASLAKKARNSLETAVKLDPNYVDARMALVDFYTIAPGFLGGSEEKALEEAAEIKKRDALQGHRAFARIYMRQKKNDLARKELVDAVREQPNNARAHQILGTFLLIEKNYGGALHEFEMALQLDPKYMPPHLRIGQHSALTGIDYARGEAALRKYLAYKPAEDEPTHAAAWYWLGTIYEKQGKKAEAKQAFMNALKLAPNDKEVREALKRTS